jgi:hypothetical protein
MRRFHYSANTNATPAEIWGMWTDVENWNTWDAHIEYAHLAGPFQEGQLGRIKLVGLKEIDFYLSDVRDKKSFTINYVLPLKTRMESWHTLLEKNDLQEFTHGVRIEGPLSWVFVFAVVRKIQKNMSSVLENVKKKLEGSGYVPTEGKKEKNTPLPPVEDQVGVKYSK